MPLFLVLSFFIVGCNGPEVEKEPVDNLTVAPIRVISVNISAALIRSAGHDTEGTLIEEPGWREYVMEFENLSTNILTVQNVRLLNQEGRYVDSALSYEQITAPPDVAVEVAGDVAGTVTGIAAGEIIPFGGVIFSLLSNTVSAFSAEKKSNAKQIFKSRVIKKVELSPAGKMNGSAFLPNITSPETLVVDYTLNGMMNHLQIPLTKQETLHL